jgi:hypothetical protein
MKKSLNNDNKNIKKKELLNENEENKDDNLKYYTTLYKLPKYLEKVI